jgi:hypothetical protein
MCNSCRSHGYYCGCEMCRTHGHHHNADCECRGCMHKRHRHASTCRCGNCMEKMDGKVNMGEEMGEVISEDGVPSYDNYMMAHTPY